MTLASLILLDRSLADRFGRRHVFVIGAAWFAVGLLLCGLAPTMPLFIAARLLQGVGGALLTPASVALVQATFRPADRTRAIGVWAGLAGVPGAIGPAARRPADAACLLTAGLLHQRPARGGRRPSPPCATYRSRRTPQAPRNLDVAGAAAATAGLAGMAYGFTAWPAAGFASPGVVIEHVPRTVTAPGHLRQPGFHHREPGHVRRLCRR